MRERTHKRARARHIEREKDKDKVRETEIESMCSLWQRLADREGSCPKDKGQTES